MSLAPPDGTLDAKLQHRYGLVAGVDEVGRGALAGPVTVAAVILDPDRPIVGLDDSKRLSPRQRQRLAPLIRLQGPRLDGGPARAPRRSIASTSWRLLAAP